VIRSEIHRQARQIADGELKRCRSLRTLKADEAALVAQAVRETAAAVADCLVEEARTDPKLRGALETIYGSFAFSGSSEVQNSQHDGEHRGCAPKPAAQANSL
jgi:uncharacterized membrane protein